MVGATCINEDVTLVTIPTLSLLGAERDITLSLIL